ncbi:MAG: cation diffusion facilitator family transporter [Gammaproteobacteria bacterium]|nr:cation diffusion facilitator family transporter [Gammaproteobacteria bacterium]
MSHGSKKAVVTAILANSIVTVIKFIAAMISGSAAMMNESVHSLMDSLNQAFLFLGLREGERPADAKFAFGHGQKKYLWNLWSAIGLFSIGAGVGLSHAWHAWHQLGQTEAAAAVVFMGQTLDPLWVNILVLVIAFLLEGYSFLVALKQYLLMMHRDGHSNPFSYLLISDDPTLVAVVLEDSVAMLGLVLAATGIGLSAVTGNGIWDIGFSALIAVMLGMIAFYLGWTNMRFLADMRDTKAEAALMQVVQEHKEVERIHDLRSIIVDENHTLLVAEIELREESIVPGLQEQISKTQKQILQQIPADRRHSEQVVCYANSRAAVQVTLARAEQIIDELEAAVREIVPRVSHITLEVEGISSTDPTQSIEPNAGNNLLS